MIQSFELACLFQAETEGAQWFQARPLAWNELGGPRLRPWELDDFGLG